jgi:fibronectin-binding autotransporter adhesin
MKKLILFSILATLGCSSEARIGGIGFFKARGPSLGFSTAAQSPHVSNCSGITTVETKNASGVATNVATNVTVNLTTADSLTFFSDSGCTNVVTSVVVATGTSSSSFYFIAGGTGTLSYTAAATGYANAMQAATVTSNPFVWTGGGGNALWSTGLNWSGGSAPSTTSHVALFDGTCSSNCSPTISASVSITGIRVNTGYAGTITQGAGATITLAGAGWVHAAGAFAGSNAAISISGPFVLSGGTFTMPAATFTASGNYWVLGTPAFSSNSGTLNITGTSVSLIVGSESYNNVGFTICGSATLSGTMNVQGVLSGSSNGGSCGSTLSGGTLLARGNVNLTNSGITAWGGTTIVKIGGSSNQTITSASSTVMNLTIESTGGTVTYAGALNVLRNYIVTSGVIDASASTLTFSGAAATVTVGTEAYNNVNLVLCGTSTFSGTMTVLGTLTGSTSGGACVSTLNGGTIEAKGNVSLTNNGFSSSGGTTLIKIAGSANQTISSVGVDSQFPNLAIASTGGTVSFGGTFTVRSALTHTTGTVDTSGSTFVFMGYGNPTITPGTMSFAAVRFATNTLVSITLSGTMQVSGNLLFDNTWTTCSAAVNTGTISVSGNVTATNYGFCGTAALNLVGSATQTITRGASADLPTGNVTIAQTGAGNVVLASNVSWNTVGQTTDLVTGSINMAGYSLTVRALTLNGNVLTKTAGVLTVNGVVSGTGALHGGTVNP